MATPIPAARAHQLDALRLDSDATGALLSQLLDALRHTGRDARAWVPQLSFLLRAIIFLHTTARSRPTPALSYLNLRYDALSITQRVALFLGFVYAPLPLQRLQGRTRAVVHLVRAFNTLLFHARADHRTALERLARVSVVYAGENGAAATPLELLNRTHVWRGLANAALAVTPLVQCLPTPAFLAASAPEAPRCPLCAELDVCMPHRAVPCGCVFCYTCVATRIEAGSFKCPRCRVLVDDLSRVTE